MPAIAIFGYPWLITAHFWLFVTTEYSGLCSAGLYTERPWYRELGRAGQTVQEKET